MGDMHVPEEGESRGLPPIPDTSNVIESAQLSITHLLGDQPLHLTDIAYYIRCVAQAIEKGHWTELGLESQGLTETDYRSSLSRSALKTRAVHALSELWGRQEFTPREFSHRIDMIELALQKGCTYEELCTTESDVNQNLRAWQDKKPELLNMLEILRAYAPMSKEQQDELISGIKDAVRCELATYDLLGTSIEELDQRLPFTNAKLRALKAVNVFRKRSLIFVEMQMDDTIGIGEQTFTTLLGYIDDAHTKFGIPYEELQTSEQEVEGFRSKLDEYTDERIRDFFKEEGFGDF